MSKLYTADKFVTIGGTTSQYVTGTGSLVTFPTIPSGSDYIQNQNASAQSANMWISGSAYVNGSVGIGTNSPFGILTIKQGAAQLDISTGSDNIVLEALDRTTLSNQVDIRSYARNGNHIWYTGAYSERMRITSAGNVGIGTSSPSGNLHVYNSSSPTLIYNQNYNGVQSYWNSSDGGIVYFGSTTNHPLAFVTNNTERIRITSGGNVGIGNSSPTEKLDVTGNVKATTFIGALSGNATTATTLQNTRSISLGTAVTSTATNFNGSSNVTIPVTGVSEAYLTWGGRSFSGSYGPIDSALMPELGANRLAFTPASAVIIEYSQDGGTTWLNYAVSDAVKINLLNGNSTTIQVGGGGYPVGTDYTNYLVRVTINTAGQIYTALNKFIILVSTNGSTGSYCTVDARTQSNYLAGIDTWTTFSNQTPVAGWSGYNVINTNNITTFGNTPASQFGQVRFTFGQTGYSTSYTGLQIIKLLGFGGVGWQTPSTLAATGQMYTYDYLKNVYFQANLTAVNFIGALSGNATTATTLQTARTINGTSFNGSSNIETSYWGATRTITIGNTAKTVNGSGNQSWSLAEIGAQATLTNPIIGTGTTNYLSKFTGTTSLGNSLVFDNGTNVGIGTTSPSSVLHLYRNSTTSPLNFSNSSSLILQNPYGSAGNTGTAIFFKSDVGTYNTFAGIGGNMVGSTANGSYGDIVFGTKAAATDTALSERMRINASGNVGIGTNSPAQKLHVEGSAAVGTTGTEDILLLGRAISSGVSFQQAASLKLGRYQNAGGSYESYTRLDFALRDNSPSSNYNTNTTVMTLTNAGNVGIGTTSPSQKLDVNGNQRISGGLLEIFGGSTYPQLSRSGASGGLIINTSGAVSALASLLSVKNNSGSDIITMLGNGNVGIGTTSPVATLDVVGSAVFGSSSSRSSFSGTVKLMNNSASQTNLFLLQAGVGSAHFGFKPSDSKLYIVNSYSTGSINDTTSIVLDTSGNVGIGNTAPTSKLVVDSNTNGADGIVSRNLNTGGSAYAFVGAFNNTGNGIDLRSYPSTNLVFPSTSFISSGSGQTGGMIITQAGANPISIWTNGSEKMRVTSDGNVGIGTTAPNAKLDVNGDALINQLTIGQGPVVGQGNTALGKGALGSMVGGKANIAVGSNANSDNDVTGLTVIGVDLNINPAGSALTQNSLVIGQYNALNYSTQYPHIYAPDKVNCPNGNTTTDIIAVDYSIYTAIFMEYSIFNSGGDQFRAGTYTAAFKSTGTVVDDDNQTVVYSGTTLSATFTTSIAGSVATIQLRNQDSDTYDIRVTARLLMR